MKSMNLPDINVWVGLAVYGHPLHASAKAWFDRQDGIRSIHFCRPTQQGFVRLLTTSAVMKGYDLEALSNVAAWSAYEGFLADPRIEFAPEPTNLDETWKSFALRKTPSPKLWMDAYLAAFAVRSGYQLVTADKAFSQFKGLDTHFL